MQAASSIWAITCARRPTSASLLDRCKGQGWGEVALGSAFEVLTASGPGTS
jgi:hypothetical protein